MNKTILGLIALQLSFGLVVAIAIILDNADKRCPPAKTSPLKDCHPYPEGGHGAMACMWVSHDHQIFPWAPTQRCDSP